MTISITKQVEAYQKALAEALEIPPARYEQTLRCHNSIGDWLHRGERKVRHCDPNVFVYGSFDLGRLSPSEGDECVFF